MGTLTSARLKLPLLWTRNGVPVALADVPVLRLADWRSTVVALCDAGARLSALLPLAGPSGQRGWDLVAVLADDRRGEVGLVRGEIPPTGVYPSLTPELPE